MESLSGLIWSKSCGTAVAEPKDSALSSSAALNFLQPLSPRISIHDLLLCVLLGSKPHSQDQLQNVKVVLRVTLAHKEMAACSFCK